MSSYETISCSKEEQISLEKARTLLYYMGREIRNLDYSVEENRELRDAYDNIRDCIVEANDDDEDRDTIMVYSSSLDRIWNFLDMNVENYLEVEQEELNEVLADIEEQRRD